jgi:hypothetical protein
VDTTKPPPSTLNSPGLSQLPANPTAQQLQTYQQMVNQYQLNANQMSAELAQAQQSYYSNKIASLTDGFLGFTVSSSSGTAGCTFSNAWLFLFNQTPTPAPTITPTFNGTPYTKTPSPTFTPTSPKLFFPVPTLTDTPGPRPNHPTATAIAPTATQPPAATATP